MGVDGWAGNTAWSICSWIAAAVTCRCTVSAADCAAAHALHSSSISEVPREPKGLCVLCRTYCICVCACLLWVCTAATWTSGQAAEKPSDPICKEGQCLAAAATVCMADLLYVNAVLFWVPTSIHIGILFNNQVVV